MTRIVIAGATGFIGSSLVQKLASSGVDVIALVRPTSDRSPLVGLPISFIQGDITEPATLRGLFAGADTVIHAAGMLGKSGVPESYYHALHVEGTRNILTEVAGCDPMPRLLYISSPGVLGPITGEPADEAAPMAPSNAYERSKAAAETLVDEYVSQGLPAIIARPEFVYGPGDSHVLGLFRAVQRRLYFTVDGGQHTCHPTYIADAVDGLLRCLQLGRVGEIYHITGPRPIPFRQLGNTLAGALGVSPPRLSLPRQVAWSGAVLLEAIAKLAGREAPLSRTGVAFFSESRRFSWAKAFRELGYSPQFELEQGSRATVAWYREQGWL